MFGDRDHDEDVANTIGNIRLTYISLGEHFKAVERYEEALAIYTRVLGVDNRESAELFFHMGRALAASGDVSGARLSMKNAVLLSNMHGIDELYSQAAALLLSELEAKELE